MKDIKLEDRLIFALDVPEFSDAKDIVLELDDSVNFYKIGMDHMSHWQVWDGNIDNVRVWNQALSQEEIQSYMNCSPIENTEELIGHWNFEEGSEQGEVLDLSGNNNNGIINGATYNEEVPEQLCVSCSDTDENPVTFPLEGCTDQ